jgi:hypothetical protein
MAISYVFPNTSDISQRGGLEERWALAEAVGCSFVEVPADMIKNGSEVEATGQDLCTFLTKKSIAAIYKPTKSAALKISYILHTEPSLGRNDNYRITSQAPLKWYDAIWVDEFVRMIIDISDFLNMPAEKIEIHPGDRRNSFSDIVQAMQKIQEGYHQAFRTIPEILLENRTGQIVSTGEEIAQFWDCLASQQPELASSAGIVLDVQQLKTVTKNKFAASFSKIPDECLKGFHIHTLHRPLKVTDSIPWKIVFRKIAGLSQDIIINPEIHHNNQVEGVIRFCNEMLKGHLE